MWVVNRNNIYLILSDFAMVFLSVLVSLLIKFDFTIPNYFTQYLNLTNLFFFIFLKITLFFVFNLYRGMYRYTSIWDLVNILKANSISSLIIFFYIVKTSENSFQFFSIIFLDLLICSLLISTSRLMIRIYFNHLKSFNRTANNFRKNIIIIGAGYSGQNIARQILNNSNYNFNIIGFLDDDISKIGNRLHGVKVLGPISLLVSNQLTFDESLICIPSAKSNDMKCIVDSCKKSGKPFKTLPSLSGLIEGKVSVSQLREVSVNDLLGREEIVLDKNSIKNFILGKRIVVTGAGGSIGSELVRQCMSYNPSLLVMVDISEYNLFHIERGSLK